MATPSTLATLIDLAHKDSDEAARHLGAALRACEESSQKLQLLLEYRGDYALRCQSNLASGISTTQLNNFQIFIYKLDQAIAGQQKVVADMQQRAAHARATWLACEQKKMSFITLRGRAEKENARREIWRDQKQNDEHGTRRSLNKPGHVR